MDTTVELLNERGKNTLVEHLGIEFMEAGKDYLVARMPVDNRTVQPLRLLHGGASVAFAETLGSMAAYLYINPDTHYCLGLEINANHIRSVPENGWVYGKVTPLHIGRRTQVWEIKITTGEDKLVCVSRITMAVVEK
jgi:1,4-dihydroxy-2-naphthoyl-CoA hydrolase